MKVQTELMQNSEIGGRNSQLLSRFTLKFENSFLESEYNEAVYSKISEKFGINPQVSNFSFITSYSFVSIIYLASYLTSYFLSHTNKASVIFQSVLIISISALNYSTLIFLIPSEIFNTKAKKFFSALFYIFTCVIIVLNGPYVQQYLFDSQAQVLLDFQTILGILPLFYTSKFVIFKTFFDYFLCHFAISIIFLALNLAFSSNYEQIFLEFSFLFFASLIEALNFYSIELKARENFVKLQNYLSPSKGPSKYPGFKTDIEEISQTVKESLTILTENLKSKSKDLHEALFDNLTKVLDLLGNRRNVYSVDMEKINNQVVDNEDKVFIQETCSKRVQPTNKHVTNFFLSKISEGDNWIEHEELNQLLKRIGKEWNFDMFYVKETTQEKPLLVVGEFCMKRYKIDSTFAVPHSKIVNFFTAIEENYKPNPYHNSSHAADVLCSFMFLMQQSILSESMQDLELFAAIIANLCHDVGHPGLTNRFLVNSKDPLALLCNFYLDNDLSVLEMMHCSTLFKIEKDPSNEIFFSLKQEDSIAIRSLIIEIILATDMSRHFDLIGKFKAKLINNNSIELENHDQRIEVIRILMKASDVGHAAKSHDLHVRWSKLVCDEFFLQGDLEKHQGLPVSMYCDRIKTDIPKSQAGFIKNIVFPIYDAIWLGLHSVKVKEVCLNQLENNMLTWEYNYQKKQRGMTEIEKKEIRPLKKKRIDFTVKEKNSKEWFV